MVEKESECEFLTINILNKINLIRENYDKFKDPKFEFGFIVALYCITLELQKPSPIAEIKNYINMYCDDLEKYIFNSADRFFAAF